ncbi:ADOP family duplicated permease [Paludibaculum fermentans]|uniref:ADOP family duplicated permease n=1 Tax=Paludibaculum fermentans TaxID=1473598 RepID=UPI003EBA3227
MFKLLRRLQYWLRRHKMEAELAEEMEFHRAMLADHGKAPAVMGNITLSREDARAVWIWPWLESLCQDAVYAFRAMRREPAFTVTALLALGSAIGLNTSLFTIFNAVALQPWPVHDPSRVVMVNRFVREGGGDFGIAEYRYLAQYARSFSGLFAVRNGERVKMQDNLQQLTYVSGNYFGVLGVQMERGRGFLDQEDLTGAPAAVAVISHEFWQNRLGADPRIVGRVIRLDDIPFTVVGVAPVDFTGTSPLRNDIWTPLPARKLLRPNDPSVQSWLTSSTSCCTPMAGRLAPGVTRTQAQAELAILLDQFRLHNQMEPQQPRIIASGTSWIDTPRKKRQVVPMILTMFLAVTLVLLLACANIGNLLLARAAARRREMAVRLSLGGSRLRIIRQLLVESMMLAAAAAGLGLAMATVVPAAVLRRLAENQAFHVTPDLNVLAYTMAVAVLSCLAFGLAPALHGTRVGGISAALKAGAGSEGAQHARLPMRSMLLSVQVAISVILLANAGLLVRGMQRAQALDPGFDVQNSTVLSIDLPASQYTGPRTMELTRNLLAQLDHSEDLPACGLALNPPLSNTNYTTSFQVTGQPGAPLLHIFSNEISSGYLAAMGMRLLAGRNFVPEDTARDVVVINEAAAKRWWPGQSPLGRTVLADEKLRQIVGVISDVYTNDLSSIEAVIYYPITGRWAPPSVVVHDRGAASLDRITAIVKEIEPRAQVRAEPLTASFSRKLQPSIYGSELAGFLGLLALAIASVGMHGVFAYVVGQRTREIGVRMALGAQPPQIVRLVLGSSARALVWGLGWGIGGATGLSILLAHSLPGIDPLDPRTYCSVVLLLSAAVVLASAAPARRAMQVDPVRALRWE